MDPTNVSKGQLKTFNDSKRHRGRRHKEIRRQHAHTPQSTQLTDQLRRELARHTQGLGNRGQEIPLLELEDDDDFMSFSQAIQARSQEIDDDPQLAQMYWHDLGSLESDAQAVLNCHW